MSIKKFIGQAQEALKETPVIGGLLKPRPKVSVLRLSGVIAEGMRGKSISHPKFEKLIEETFDEYGVKAVALIINSPGGSPAQSALIGSHIRRLADEKEIPVYAFVEDVAASGGYWLACAADEIYTQEVSIVGSIGVISAGFGLDKLAEKYGVERRVHSSGKEKSFLDPFLPEKEGDVKRLTSIQKDLHQSFIAWVKKRREDKLKGKDKDLFEGQFWLGGRALELGIIDGFGDMREFCREKFGEDVKFIEHAHQKGLIAGFLHGDDTKLSGASLPDAILETIESRAIWGRYGL